MPSVVLLLADASPPGPRLPPPCPSALVLPAPWAGPRRTVQGEVPAAFACPTVRHSVPAAREIRVFFRVGLLWKSKRIGQNGSARKAPGGAPSAGHAWHRSWVAGRPCSGRKCRVRARVGAR